MDDDLALLKRMGVETETLNAGCCGLAGSWGFENGHYDVSIAAGEQGLLPKVRSLPTDTLVVANGFSCKTQIEQAKTGRRPLHVAQVLELAREGRYPSRPRPSAARRALRVGVPLAATALAIAGSIGLRR